VSDVNEPSGPPSEPIEREPRADGAPGGGIRRRRGRSRGDRFAGRGPERRPADDFEADMFGEPPAFLAPPGETAGEPSGGEFDPAVDLEPRPAINLTELKRRSPAQLLEYAEELGIENASTLKKNDLVFVVLKRLADADVPIYGEGVLEILQDGFGFLRSPDVNYVAGPDDVYVSPSQIRRFGLRTGDVVEGQVRAPKEGERYFALLRANTINFDAPEKARHRVHFDNLTPY
jgi:transcription termination factor Rho